MSKVMRCKMLITKCAPLIPYGEGTTATKFAPAGINVESIVGCQISMGAVYGTEAERENSVFGKYTPMGSFEATILNADVARALCTMPKGTEFYVDFTLAPKEGEA